MEENLRYDESSSSGSSRSISEKLDNFSAAIGASSRQPTVTSHTLNLPSSSSWLRDSVGSPQSAIQANGLVMAQYQQPQVDSNNNNGPHLSAMGFATGSISDQQPASSQLIRTTATTEQQTSNSNHNESTSNIINRFSDLVSQYVNLNLVRKMIAQNQIEFLIICVIITYLIYYFCRISRKPRLIGHNRSKFVRFIKLHLSETIEHRFSPLIYFWGTNPQTALFGYLQGQTSLNEMPRNKFRRQYLYVSDAQYLTTNVDLSQYYGSSSNNNNKTSAAGRRPSEKQRQLQLQVAQLQGERQSYATGHQQQTDSGLLNANIRLALDQMMGGLSEGKLPQQSGQSPPALPVNGPMVMSMGDKRDLSSSSSASGSSSDSGVFAGHSSSSSCSSTSSLAEVLIESVPTSADQAPKRSAGCSCKYRYDLEPTIFAGSPLPPATNAAADGSAQTGTATESAEFGQCALDWHKSSHRHYHRNKLVALISAGMTTGSDKKYVTDTVMTLERLGYEVCVFIRRGVGGLKLSSAKFFSPAKWRDFEAAVLSVRQQRPGARLVAVGFSFGSIELCRYLSMSGKRSLVHAALLISCPFDPEAGGRNMRKRALNRRIDAYLAKNLGKQLYHAMFGSNGQPDPTQSNLSNLNGSLIDLSNLPKIKSLVDFEDNYNRPLQNYPDSRAYAIDSRLHEHLKFIETPTLCLSSEDDFMAPVKLLPLKEIKSNKNLCMILTKRGGHMAFINGILWPKKPYFAQRIIERYMGAVKNSLLFEFDRSPAAGSLQPEEQAQVPLLAGSAAIVRKGSQAEANGQVPIQFCETKITMMVNEGDDNNNHHNSNNSSSGNSSDDISASIERSTSSSNHNKSHHLIQMTFDGK